MICILWLPHPQSGILVWRWVVHPWGDNTVCVGQSELLNDHVFMASVCFKLQSLMGGALRILVNTLPPIGVMPEWQMKLVFVSKCSDNLSVIHRRLASMPEEVTSPHEPLHRFP